MKNRQQPSPSDAADKKCSETFRFAVSNCARYNNSFANNQFFAAAGHIMSSHGHVRSTQRGSRGLHFSGSSYARKPRGMNGISQRAIAQTPGSPRAARALLSMVEDSYPAISGFPSQPESSRYPIRDDRIESAAESVHRRSATPRPNGYTLREDERSWVGGRLTSLRGGKHFTLPTHTVFHQLPSPIARTAHAIDAQNIAQSCFYDVGVRPLSATCDRAIPKPSWVPRGAGTPFAPATDWSWCGGPAPRGNAAGSLEKLDSCSAAASSSRLHATPIRLHRLESFASERLRASVSDFVRL